MLCKTEDKEEPWIYLEQQDEVKVKNPVVALGPVWIKENPAQKFKVVMYWELFFHHCDAGGWNPMR